MSYIIKKFDPLVNLKLTDTGRKNLANGSLTFAQFGLGDSEVDYLTHDSAISNILRPADNNPDIMYPVPSEGTNYLTPITNLNSIPKELKQPAEERGAFSAADVDGFRTLKTGLLTDSGLRAKKTADPREVIINYYAGGQPSTIAVGHYLVFKGKYLKYTSGTPVSGSTALTGDENSFEEADTFLVFRVETVQSWDSGTTVKVRLDRAVPQYNFDYLDKTVVFVIPDSNLEDNETPTEYWDDNVLEFNVNGSPDEGDYPYFNFSLVLIEDMIGLDPTIDKNKTQTEGKKFLGTSVLLKYYEEAKLDKIGIVHFTNSSISNQYGEGFYRDTFKLSIPQLLWHKKQMGGTGLSEGTGYTFICDKELKVLGGKIRYYDLVDSEVNKTVVGKVFVDYKITIIEDSELLMAMSIKGNRNWTLPKPKLTATEPGTCINSSTFGALRAGEALHVTYILYDTHGITPVHCNNYTTISLAKDGSVLAKDVIFEFPKDPNNPLYSEFGYLRDNDSNDLDGFKANRVAIIWQKTDEGAQPNPALWDIKDVTSYIGTTGCVSQNTEIADNFVLASNTYMGTGVNTFVLTDPAIGDVIAGVSTGMLYPASTIDDITSANPYFYDKATGTVHMHDDIKNLVIVFYYLKGETLTTYSRVQQYETPATLLNDTFTGLYNHTATSKACIHLDYQPSNSVVYLFYNGQLISSNNYSVYNDSVPLNERRVELNFTPAVASQVMIYYLDAAGVGVDPVQTILTAANFNNLRVFIDKDFLDASKDTPYNLRDFIVLPTITDVEGPFVTFGDDKFLFAVVNTDIKATIYKSVMTCNVLPNKYIASTNPTFNTNQDKAKYSEIGIYDNDNDLVAIGKFSQPLERKYNSDILVIQATIDF